MKNKSLTIQHNPILKLVSHTGYSKLFYRFYKNIEFMIRELKIRLPIFFVKYKDHDLILS